MDNSTTTWIMVALLLLLIGAAIFMLLRRPGGDDTAVDSRDDSAVGSRDVVAEGRDLGPGTAAPGIDARGATPADDRTDARDQPFDQHADDDRRVGDDQRVDDDADRWREAEAVTAVGADGAGAGDAASERGHRAEETDYVVRGDDHEPVAGGAYADDASGATVDHTVVDDTHHADVEHTHHADDSHHADVDTRAEGDGDQMRQAAAIGAMGAAATGAATSDRAPDDEVRGEPVHEEPFHDEPADVYRSDDHHAGHDEPADVHALTSEEIDAGARDEPLPADDQTPGETPEEVTAHEESSDSPVEGYDRSGVDDHDRGTDHEQPLDDSATTTYRGHGGEAVVVEDVVGEPGMQEEHGYHDDTTPVRGDDGPALSSDTTYPPDTTAAAGERVVADEPIDTGAQGTGAAAGAGAAAVGAAGAAHADRTYAGEDTDGAYNDAPAGDTAYGEPHRDTGDSSYAGTDVHRTDGAYDDAPAGDTAYTEQDQATSETAYAEPDRSYGDADAPAAAGGAVFSESVYGPGSADPAEDGSGPEGWVVKGNSGSMLFHTEESPSYDAVRAEVWFESEEAARAAGFAHWDRRRR